MNQPINSLSSEKHQIKHYNISECDKLFRSFGDTAKYKRHRDLLTKGAKIGLDAAYPSRVCDNQPSFSIDEKIGIGQQLQKWLRTGVVVGPFDVDYAKHNDVTSRMLFGVPKPDGATRPILNLSDKRGVGCSINEVLDPNLCTVECAQLKEGVQVVQALGKDAWLWAKDLKDGHYDVPIHESDIKNWDLHLKV